MQHCWDPDPHLRPEVLEALQVLRTPSVSCSSRWSYIREFDWFLVCSGDPTWKQLISYPLSAHERIPLITAIFSDQNQVEMVGHLSGNDAQAFIDLMDEVSVCALPPEASLLILTKAFSHCWPGIG